MSGCCGGGGCCATPVAVPPAYLVEGTLATPAGPVPRIRSAWGAVDRRGAIAVRFGGLYRQDYRWPPGLCAVGSPGPEAPVLVTANYKLSVDHLRRALAGRDAWILVLDTDGINVWCAAGKGSFGTDELLRRLAATNLEAVVTHRRLILPQLGAPGVSAPRIQAESPWRVRWGPVRADDLGRWLDGDGDTELRRVRFTTRDRLVLAPVELRQHALKTLVCGLLLAALTGLAGGVPALAASWPRLLALVGGTWIAGCLLGPLLLPWLPGRAFALKGALLGLALGAVATWGLGIPAQAGGLLFAGALTSFLLLQFTGCATFTHITGVERELRWALPAQGLAALAGLGLWTWAFWS